MPIPKRIIFITTDHMRSDFIGSYGNSVVQTPNLDRLTRTGVNFHNCFAQNPLCMPSRASFMTGLYPQQTGVVRNGYCLPPEFYPTMPRLFENAGFQTAHFGKLHLQPHEEHDLRSEPDYDYGFNVFSRSEVRGSYQDAWMTWLAGEYPEHLESFRTMRAINPRRMEQEKTGYVVEAPSLASHSGWVVEEARRYLSCAFGDRLGTPLFMHLGFHNPHPPLNPTREAFAAYENVDIPVPAYAENEWKDKPEPLNHMLMSRQDWQDSDFVEYRRYFYALVTEFDLAIGRLLDQLEQLYALDDTLIVFTSDHGDMCGNHRMTSKGAHFYDEVMRVPLIFHWPAGIGTTQRDTDQLVELVDVLPTLLDCCGLREPPMLMGRSLASTLSGEEPSSPREDVFAFDICGAMLRTDRYKYLRYGSGGEVLFDLRDDTPEVRNVLDDPLYADTLADVRSRLIDRLLSAGQSPYERRFRF